MRPRGRRAGDGANASGIVEDLREKSRRKKRASKVLPRVIKHTPGLFLGSSVPGQPPAEARPSSGTRMQVMRSGEFWTCHRHGEAEDLISRNKPSASARSPVSVFCVTLVGLWC